MTSKKLLPSRERRGGGGAGGGGEGGGEDGGGHGIGGGGRGGGNAGNDGGDGGRARNGQPASPIFSTMIVSVGGGGDDGMSARWNAEGKWASALTSRPRQDKQTAWLGVSRACRCQKGW